MGVTTVFPKPCRPIKGGSRNSGTAVGSPAPQRDRHEEGAHLLACWGFSRVLPELKDVPGEAAAGVWGSRCLRRTRWDLRDPTGGGGTTLGGGMRGAEACGIAAFPTPSAGSAGVGAGHGGGAHLPAGPAPQANPAPSWPLRPAPSAAVASPAAALHSRPPCAPLSPFLAA